MRRRLIAGNWKMNGTLDETRRLLEGLVAGLEPLVDRVDLLVLPPFTVLADASRFLRDSGASIHLGAQDLHFEAKGPFTGEISGAMLRDIGATHVLIGHSERRTWFAEKGELLEKKLRAALRAGLVPILCIGESLAERERGRTEDVLDEQLSETLLRLGPDEARKVVLAYEPVWAIGTGKHAAPAQAEEAHRHIRAKIAFAMGGEIAAEMKILYGGSVNGANASGLLARPGVDGALVGGASLSAEEFLKIARASAN